MKKILIASMALIAFASCKKNYICECTETDTYGGTTTVSTSTTEFNDVKKKYVESSYDCVSYTSTNTNSDGNVSTYKVDCTIKDN
jgi:hypothetical protein